MSVKCETLSQSFVYYYTVFCLSKQGVIAGVFLGGFQKPFSFIIITVQSILSNRTVNVLLNYNRAVKNINIHTLIVTEVYNAVMVN